MTDRFHMGGALDGSLTSFVPIANSLFNETCFRTVMRQQFRLSFSRLWKLCLQYQGNMLMVLLPCAP